ASDLPESLRPFAHFHAVRLTQERVRADMTGIVKAVGTALTEIERDHAEKENASWEQIKDTLEPAPVKAHLERFPAGSTAAAARARLQMLEREHATALRWRAIAETDQPEVLEDFIRAFPGSSFETQARARLVEIHRARENAAWEVARVARHAA